jgi:hypothetical protein
LSYVISILYQHALHRYIVFGTSTPYLKSLIGTYLAYGVSIFLSHFFMLFLSAYLGLQSNVAWTVNIVATGFLNFFLVGSAFK